MKRTFEHPAPSERELTGPQYWRSLDELAATPGFKAQVEREFPADASNLNGVDRRQFFKLMAASFALGGLGLAAGCRRPEKHILPYGKSVEDAISGLPLYFASAMPTRKGAVPIKRVELEYPKSAIRMGIEKGHVVARLNIDEKGNVTSVSIVSADPPRHFDRAVVDALMQWKFAADGEKYVGEIEVDFKLQ